MNGHKNVQRTQKSIGINNNTKFVTCSADLQNDWKKSNLHTDTQHTLLYFFFSNDSIVNTFEVRQNSTEKI